jgi:hypothetical protein
MLLSLDMTTVSATNISSPLDTGKRSITTILSSGPGSAVMLVPGGASEALVVAPGKYDVITKRRKGFVKMAIETGACLVPVIAFGEPDCFGE